ncbi:hypothetical protein B7L70_01355 [Vulcanisaeta sp. EB80]|nr:hypothetical protein B7L70_01355 [Vulcanisaeta sp. EB80]
MVDEEDKKSSNEASLPKPTQAGRIETCTKLIRQAKKCLEDNNRNCAVQTLEKNRKWVPQGSRSWKRDC